MGDFERAKFTGGYTDDDFGGAPDIGGDDDHRPSTQRVQDTSKGKRTLTTLRSSLNGLLPR